MNDPRNVNLRTANITRSITKSAIWIGGFLAGTFLWLGPLPADDRPAKEPFPQMRILEGEALKLALQQLDEKVAAGEFTLIYLVGHDPVLLENGEGAIGLPAR